MGLYDKSYLKGLNNKNDKEDLYFSNYFLFFFFFLKLFLFFKIILFFVVYMIYNPYNNISHDLYYFKGFR